LERIKRGLIKMTKTVNTKNINHFNCPNCKQKMIFKKQTKYDKEIYDLWTCKVCSHILVLDYRGKVIKNE
jgi:transcription initiation factor IIE alpha subunit